MAYVIYCHTHIASGRRYVGQTCNSMEKRWRQHVQHAKSGQTGCRLFNEAIRAFGAEAFNHETLEVVQTPAEAGEAESRWIRDLGTVSPNGFNLHTSARGRHDETRQRMSASAKAKFAKMSPEERTAIAVKTRDATSPERRAEGRRTAIAKMGPGMAERTRAQFAIMTLDERRRHMAPAAAAARAMTPEQRSDRTRRANAAMTPETRASRSAKLRAAFTFEQRSVHMLAVWAASTPEQRADRVARTAAGMPRERLREVSKAWQARRTPEERSESSRKAVATRRARGHMPARADIPEAEVLSARANGVSITAIARTFRADWRTIRNILKANGAWR